MAIVPLPISGSRLPLRRRYFETIGVMAGRILRDLNSEPILLPCPLDLALGPQQFHLANLALVMRSGTAERLDEHLVVRWPAKSKCVQDIPFSCEAYVRVVEFVF